MEEDITKVAAMILTINAAGGSIKGRTTLQKWLYFISVKTGLKFGFIPHFYGPYSEDISSLVNALIASDFLQETGKITGYSRIMYTYALTEDGRRIAKDLRKKHKQLYKTLKEVVDTCSNVAGNSTSILSWAAKIYYLLQKQGSEITYSKLRSESRSLGWSLSKEEVDSGAKLLAALKLARAED